MDYLVEVAIGTYNHKKFITQCIESVLKQKTNFPYRLIIGDDGSTDGTQDIILKYYKKYPNKIKVILYKKNRGLIGKNVMRKALYETCKAKYVTILEGDDFWSDNYKLQQQVDFMENHPECSICYHPVKIMYLDLEIERNRLNCIWKFEYGNNRKINYTLEEFLKQPLIHDGLWPEIPVPGMMLRWNLISHLPDWFWYVLRGDTALNLLFGHYGTIEKMSDKYMAVHRKHKKGISNMFFTNPDYMKYDILKIYFFIDKHCNYKYNSLLKTHIIQILDYFKKKSKINTILKKIFFLWKKLYKENFYNILTKYYNYVI